VSGESFPEVPGVEHRFVQAGGLRMHVAEAGEGEPMLLLHGWPQHWYAWRKVIPQLAPHVRVICPDFRGFGWSDVPDGGYDRETMARDVLALMDALDLQSVRLVGHDWGGWIGFLLALGHPERFERCLALGIVPPWPSRDPLAVLDIWRVSYQLLLGAPLLGRGAVSTAMARAGLRSAGDAMTEEDISAFTDRLHGERGRASELLYRTFLLRELAPVALGRYDAARLSVPTRLVVGERDPVLSTRTLKQTAARSDAVELEVVPGAGHHLADERPDLVADRALGLLRS
jgi:pimeloyl-ACP methyl ester carboxylesterase